MIPLSWPVSLRDTERLMDRVITVDGFASSGKSTLSRELAGKLNWSWFSTGVIYRGMAYIGEERKFKAEDFLDFVASKKWRVHLDREKTRFFHGSADITENLYTSAVDEKASQLSAWSEFRKALIPFQRAFLPPPGAGRGLIAEGRDCGTQIFPSAPLKIFLTAEEKVRAERRSRDRKGESEGISFVLRAQKERDQRDKTRDFAPTVPAKGSLVLNTGGDSLQVLIQKAYEAACGIFPL